MATTPRYMDKFGLEYYHNLIKKGLIEYIVGTQTGATNAWTGVSTSPSLFAGKVIIYHLPFAGNGTAATLNLTLTNGSTTGAKAVQNETAGAVTTEYAAGSDIFMVYSGSVWKCSAVDTTYAPLNNPEFTGTPTAPTAVEGTRTTQIATTEFTTAAVEAEAETRQSADSGLAAEIAAEKARVDSLVLGTTTNASGWNVETLTQNVTVSGGSASYNFTIPADATVLEVAVRSAASTSQPWITDNVNVYTNGTEAYVQADGLTVAEVVLKITYGKQETINLPELTDIRLGADGKTYSTAGEAVRGQISDVKSDLEDNFGLVRISDFVVKKYLNTNVNIGSVVSLTEQSSNGYSYKIFECSANSHIMITGRGGNNPRLWAFLDSEYKLLAKSDNALSASGLIVTAPSNTAWCIINTETSALGACYITPDWYGVKASIISNTQADAMSVPSNSDLNDYTTSGNYKVTTTAIANSLSNCPTNSSGRLIVMTLNSNSNVFQVYISVKGEIFTREKDSNGWSDWASSTYALKLRSTDSEAIAENSDLNNYTSAGNYYVATTAIAQSLANYPVKKSGRLIVMTLNSASNIFQIYITAEGVVYTREKDNSGWSAWSTRTEPLNLKYEDTTSIPSGADLNDYTTPGNFKVTTTAIANSLINGATNAGGRLVAMTLASTNSILQTYISVYGKIYTRKKDVNYWSYWEEVATNPEELTYGAKGAYNALQAVIQQSDYNMAFANAFTPLSLLNYLRNTQNVHPKVLYFENGFGGHKYWMVYTPYPYSDDIYENPCVAYSDDGYAWKNISGNPLDTPQGNGYNSDGHLVYRPDTSTLELWYRYFDRDTEVKSIYRKTSTDGVTWSARELIKTFSAEDDCASPAVEWDGTNYNIWGVSAGVTIDYYTASGSDVTTWTKVRSFSITADDGGVTVRPWHIDVIIDSGTYIMLLMCRNTRNVSDGVWSLFITTSSDNVTYSTPVKVVGGAESWDKYMYRSSIVKVGSKYRIYYSAGSTKSTTSIYNNAYWGIGITESDTLLTGYIGKYE